MGLRGLKVLWCRLCLIRCCSTGGHCGLGDGGKDGCAGIGFAEIARASGSLGLRTYGVIFMRGDENHRGRVVDCGKPLTQFQPGDAAQLDVEHEAIESRALGVLEEGFGGWISDG